MKEKDLDACRTAFKGWFDQDHHRNFLLLSPSQGQIDLIKELRPDADITCWNRENYNVDLGPPSREFDVVFCGNVLMCAKDPERWLRNLFESCSEVWLQDLVRAWRDGHRETSPETGDHTRYAFPSRGELSRDSGFDLESSEAAYVEDVVFYDDDGATDHEGKHRDCRKFVARLSHRPSRYVFPSKIVLDVESSHQFLEEMKKPPEPSPELVKIFKKNKAKKENGDS